MERKRETKGSAENTVELYFVSLQYPPTHNSLLASQEVCSN